MDGDDHGRKQDQEHRMSPLRKMIERNAAQPCGTATPKDQESCSSKRVSSQEQSNEQSGSGSQSQGAEQRNSDERSRSRSNQHSQENRGELELERQRIRELESQLRQEREQRREYEQRNRRQSPMPLRDYYDGGRSRYEPTYILEELLEALKNKTRECSGFPSVLNNVIPEFDPMCKEQTISVWLNKVDECADIYKWDDIQVCHYALPKLAGQAKLWYQGLTSLKHSWAEWKQLLMTSFSGTENFADLLMEMLNTRAQCGDSLELYYFSKINLLNRCKIFGKEAINCIIHGIDDRCVRIGAQAANFETLEQVLQYFKTVN